jgi:hypothetical protein
VAQARWVLLQTSERSVQGQWSDGRPTELLLELRTLPIRVNVTETGQGELTSGLREILLRG